MENSQLRSKNSSATVVQRQRAFSDPRSRVTPARPLPSPPPRPPPRGPHHPSLSGECRVQNSLHMISESRSKTLPTRHPASRKTTKYGTPLPLRPAPPPPRGKASPKHQITPIPKPRNSPVPKPRSVPLPKPQNPQNSSQTLSSRDPQQLLYLSDTMAKHTAATNVVECPLYEDLDKVGSHRDVLHSCSSSDDKNELAEEGPSSLNRETPPELPPKKGSKVKKEEELPPLPPRSSHPAANITGKHRLFTNHREEDDRNDRPEQERKESVQDTGQYEVPDSYESDQSQDSYTEMNDPAHETSNEDDRLEDIYIMMDPHEYIPPPESYKPKAKKRYAST